MKILKTRTASLNFIFILIVFVSTTEAQIGVKMGTTLSSFSYSNEDVNPNLSYDIDLRPYLGYDIEWVQLGEQKALFSPYIGVYYNYQFAKRLGARLGLDFTQKGVNFSQREYERIIYRVKINYLELPLSIGCQFIKKEKFISEIYIGGYGAFKINAVKKVAYDNSEVRKTQLNCVENFEAGLHFGLNFKYKIFEKFFLMDIRVFSGLTDIFYMPEDQIRLYYSTPKTKIAGINLTFGYEL